MMEDFVKVIGSFVLSCVFIAIPILTALSIALGWEFIISALLVLLTLGELAVLTVQVYLEVI